MKKVLVLFEKNNRLAFDVSSREQFEKIALSIIGGRFRANWFLSPSIPEACDISEKYVLSVPVSLRDEAKRRLEVYKAQMRHYMEELEDYQDVGRCVKDKDARLAVKLLGRFRHREYEGFEIFDISDDYSEPGQFVV